MKLRRCPGCDRTIINAYLCRACTRLVLHLVAIALAVALLFLVVLTAGPG